MSNDYCFRKAEQGQLSQYNRRNTVLRAEVKSHKVLKEVKVFAFECSVRNLKNFSKFAGKNPYWNLFIVKFQPGIAYKKKHNKGYSVNFIKKETPIQRLLHKYFPVSFEKIMNTILKTSVALK